MSDSLDERVRAIVADSLNLPMTAITDATGPGNPAAWDSLGHLNVVIGLEQEFGVSFDPDDVEAMTTVDAIIELLRVCA